MLLGLVGVSGAGKTYFKEKIVEKLGFEKVNTIRTRQKRNEEQEGKVGFFRTEEELDKLNREGKIIYQFKVFGGMYAYLKEEILTEKNMIFEMHYTMIDDWKKIRPDIKTIYILPKNLEIAKQKQQKHGDVPTWLQGLCPACHPFRKLPQTERHCRQGGRT